MSSTTAKVIKEPSIHSRPEEDLIGGLNYFQDVVKYINKCNICTKNLPNMAKYPQKHLEIPQIPMAVSAIDTIGHLPVTSKGNRWALTEICLNTLYVFTVPMKEILAENVVQAYLSGILAHKGGNVAILSDNGTEFKNKTLNEACDQLGIKRFSSLFHPNAIQEQKMFIIFLNKHLQSF